MSALVKAIYKQPEYMDPIVEGSMIFRTIYMYLYDFILVLSAADVNLNALTMDKATLKFTDPLMEKYFKKICAKDAFKYSKLIFYIFSNNVK